MLALVFYGLFTPVGFLLRLCGRDPLTLQRPAGRKSYWMPKAEARDARSYLRQF
jgi:hypothetical protein